MFLNPLDKSRLIQNENSMKSLGDFKTEFTKLNEHSNTVFCNDILKIQFSGLLNIYKGS